MGIVFKNSQSSHVNVMADGKSVQPELLKNKAFVLFADKFKP